MTHFPAPKHHFQEIPYNPALTSTQENEIFSCWKELKTTSDLRSQVYSHEVVLLTIYS